MNSIIWQMQILPLLGWDHRVTNPGIHQSKGLTQQPEVRLHAWIDQFMILMKKFLLVQSFAN